MAFADRILVCIGHSEWVFNAMLGNSERGYLIADNFAPYIDSLIETII